jgi:SagB-type dehydrogenase family enzyme
VTETLDYVNAVLRRTREPMEPIGFRPDWDDKPWRHKVYDGVARLPLPRGGYATGPVAGLLDPPGEAGDRFTLRALSDMLLHSYGLLSRRLALTGNEDSDRLPWFAYASTGRGTASGGGLYSVEIYWVAGPGGPVPPGVYHYASQHHAIERLLVGDVTARVRAALGGETAAGGADQFLLLSVKFWKNAFKYNSFCYHVVTSDLGTLLGTWSLWTRSAGLPLRAALWFDEPDLNDLLGLRTMDESVFAVVPLPWSGASTVDGKPAAGDPPAAGRAAVTRTERERSARVVRFDWTDRVHAEMVHSGPRPEPAARRPAVAAVPARDTWLPLPRPHPDQLAADTATAIRSRRSSFGAFTAAAPMSTAELSAVLAVAATGRRLRTDVSDAAGGPPLTRFGLFVNHVRGVRPGVYDADVENERLGVVEQGPVGRFLQDNYFLNNYNLEQAAAVLAVIGRPAAVLAALGSRGYRVLNAEMGAAAQATYVGAAAAGLGCGAVFGFDNVAVAERLGLAGSDEWPLLLIMLGHERRGVPAMDHRFV